MMDSKSAFAAGRAIVSTIITYYVSRILLLILITLLVATVIVILLNILFSSWWLVLLFVTVPLFVVGLVLYAITRYAASKISPRKLSKKESREVRSFVSEVQKSYITARVIKKSPSAMGATAVFTYLSSGKEKAVRSVLTPIESTKSLKEKFIELTKLFSNQRQN